MSERKGRVVLITGASSGMSEATARLLAERGAKVAMGAQRTERLEKIATALTHARHAAIFRMLDEKRVKLEVQTPVPHLWAISQVRARFARSLGSCRPNHFVSK